MFKANALQAFIPFVSVGEFAKSSFVVAST